MTTNPSHLASWSLALGIIAASAGLSAQSSRREITVISGRGTDGIPISEFSDVAMVPLARLAELVGADLRPAAEQGVMLSGNDKTARIADGRNFVYVQQRLLLLHSPARRVSENWFVPLDFITKVLPTFSKEALTYRESERMLIVGDRFPTLEVRSTRDPAYTRVEVTTSLEVPIEIAQLYGEIRLTIQTPFLRTNFENEEVGDEVVERISLRRGERNYELSVRTGSRFYSLQASKRDYPEHGVVLDLLRSRVPTRPGASLPGQVETIPEDLRSVEERGEEPLAVETAPAPIDEIVLTSGPGDPGSPEDVLYRDDGPTRLRIVALDPGHGGAEVGAEGKDGLIEKDLVLSIARRLRELLQERLGLRVILTRDGDRNLALDERTAVANNNKADLFISIHADASPSRDARGSSVYFLSYSSSDAESAVTPAGGRTSGLSGGAGLDFILWDMAQASHLSQSSRLAEIFQEELLTATSLDLVNRGIKQNTFRVLKGATMPAVLVEVGFISNPEEEELLKSQAHQEKLAEALYRGVVRFKEVYEYQPQADGASAGRRGQK
ncbi:MAG: N-acetylmuramoyl-L-alanine amidase [Vicinamibacteria bacterium]